ncbi:hypothetical protein [Sinorhizobium meliloti]|uniref:hypothetical protein n=1 Tax=Rhizobium meliloti TaxID=382 RepID=UPI00299EA1BD
MPDFAHIASSFATDPLTSLLLAIPLSFALIVVSERIWWVHGPFALVLLILSIPFSIDVIWRWTAFSSAYSPFHRFAGTFPTSRCFFGSGFSGFQPSRSLPPSSTQQAVGCTTPHRSTSYSSTGKLQPQPS